MSDLEQRIPEPELMEDQAQAIAYARADFSEPHDLFVEQFKESFLGEKPQHALDLGCGPGDITRRFARAFPSATVVGVDGSRAMLAAGQEAGAGPDLSLRVKLVYGHLPGAKLPRREYDTIISNSLLHHLEDPLVLWRCVREYAAPGARVFVIDLLRPFTREHARALVEKHSGGEPELLKHDFFHSLLAAYRPDEVGAQLQACGLAEFVVRAVSDRHLCVCGRVAG